VATDDCNGTLPCDDAVEPNPVVQALVVDPVEAYLEELGDLVIGTSQVDLDGLRSSVRSMEANEGNLIADSQRWQAAQLAAAYGVPVPDVALQNGGGIRNNTIIPAGPITELDTFGMVPFANFVSVVPYIPRDQFKEILENAVACTQPGDFATNPLCGSGRFAQVSGFSFTWTASGTGMVIDGNGNVVTPGTRVLDVTLDDGTPIVVGGVVQTGPPVTIAIVDFLANGGDQYPFRGAPFTTVGVTYQQALANYIQDPTGLNGLISAADYPEGGEGRITNLP
jgi:5'-nucleotidase